MQETDASAQRKSSAEDFAEQDLQAVKYVNVMQPLLQRLHDANTERDRANNRDLFFDQYAMLVLLYFFNPVITSLRGIKHASTFRKLQKSLGISETSLGSLSEASRVFDAELLQPIIGELAQQVQPFHKGMEAASLKNLTAVDGSLLPALPRMAWALWNFESTRAARLHLHFEVFRGAPAKAKITSGQGSEKQAMHEMLEANRFYVMDRGYEQFRLFQAIVDADSSFVCCVRDHMTWKVIEERALPEEAQRAGVIFDAVVNLGADKAKGVLKQPYRVIKVDTGKTDKTGEPVILLLVSNRLDLDAEMLASAYRHRWQIEIFFRWMKCILGCRHLLSTSQNGVTIQIYLALIASLLISLWTGRKPTKRTYETLCFYFMGVAELDELMDHIDSLKKLD